MISKESIIETLEMLQTNVCAYSFMKKSKMCDCKFKKLNASINIGSETGCGCPELGIILQYLNKLDKTEWDKILYNG